MLIGNNYLTIRRWVPNFVPDEAPIRFLTTWIRIPNISIEYFDVEFLNIIGQKVGRVIGIDQTTTKVDSGRFSKISVEVDLSKPLLSKFRLNGRVWRMQYEELKFICFKCGKVGHREDNCPIHAPEEDNHESGTTPQTGHHDPTKTVPMQRPECSEDFGSWMMVKKPVHRKNPKVAGPTTTGKVDSNRTENRLDQSRNNSFSKNPGRKETLQNTEGIMETRSRFSILEDLSEKENPLENSTACLGLEDNTTTVEKNGIDQHMAIETDEVGKSTQTLVVSERNLLATNSTKDLGNSTPLEKQQMEGAADRWPLGPCNTIVNRPNVQARITRKHNPSTKNKPRHSKPISCLPKKKTV